MKWDRKDTRIWTTVVDVTFERGLLTSARPVALRIAPEDPRTMRGDYRLDRKSMAMLPWEAVTPTSFPTKAAAVAFAKRYVAAAGTQNTYTPRL